MVYENLVGHYIIFSRLKKIHSMKTHNCFFYTRFIPHHFRLIREFYEVCSVLFIYSK